MKFRGTLLLAGKTATGFEVPAEVVADLGAGKKPAVTVTLNNGYSYRSSVGSMGGKYMLPVSAEHRAGAGIAGATQSTYRVTAADAGSVLSVAVTATKTGYVTLTRMSTATSPVPRLLTASTPTITGKVKVGSTLTAQPGTWSPSVRFSYQWFRGSRAIKGATKSTYRVPASDVGARLAVRDRVRVMSVLAA